MTAPLGSYTFLPWLRQGISRTVTAADHDKSVRFRATTPVELSLTGQPLPGTGALATTVKRNVELYGPGEVVGIETRAVIRTDPRPWITDVEPNYLAHIEFYDEDFPWRYTPAAPNSLALRPWITLVVLKEGAEFDEGTTIAGRPLPFITVKDFTNTFPKAGDLWAWAHVHTNVHLGASAAELLVGDAAAAVARLETTLATNRDLGYSRIVCPRRLDTNTAYHAFLVPTFERGRLAGLGKDPDIAEYATQSAWEDYGARPETPSMPYYYRWYFRTGGEGDFESLVRLLKWKTVDARVGTRNMNVLDPGSNVGPIDDAALDLDGVLRLSGALRAPDGALTEAQKKDRKKYDTWWGTTYPREWQEKFAAFVNLGDQFTKNAAEQAKQDAGIPKADPEDVDPIVTAPIYGEWQALQHRLLVDPDGAPLDPNDNWIHNLNLDPQYRVPGGFGGDVVRKHQEDYMEAAWKQVGDVLQHNQKARVAAAAMHLGEAAHAKTIAAVAAQPTRVLSLTAAVQSRFLASDVTLRHSRQQSLTPAVLTSSTMRRVARPNGPIARRLNLGAGPHANAMLEAVNEGKITAAPPKQAPAGLTTVEGAATAAAPKRRWPPEWLIKLDRRFPWLRWLLLGLAVLLLILALVASPVLLLFVCAFLALAALAAAVALALAGRAPNIDEVIGPDLDNEASIDRLPAGPGFEFGIDKPSGGATGSDNEAARRFKLALKDWAKFAGEDEKAGREVPLTKIDLSQASAAAVAAVRPLLTIPRRFLAGVDLADHVTSQIVELFDEIKYYPRIDEPMYRPLKGLSDDHFVPNLNLIERDTVVALKTNQKFIEAYMVGVNHEFSRELLWREYPTDMRGTYFRQFWDITSQLAATTGGRDERDKLYDILPIHRWPRRSRLGEHDNREPDPSQQGEEIVLVVRGELLKKYPNTVVYAHKAEWARKDNGQPDFGKERELAELPGAELEKPPPTKVQTPIYEAKVDPDIYFFGFALSEEDVKGEENNAAKPGWFFVLKERPGEARFGFDISRPAGEKIVTVNDLTWAEAGATPGKFLEAQAMSVISLNPPGIDEKEKQDQHNDDLKVVTAPVSAARWGYLMYQMPVMVAVHAAEMLGTRETY